jgi:pimeloyl-ACP methyl ester carboxylesterase
MQYYVEPFLERILDTPTLVVVAEGDDYTMWEQEIGAYNKIPTDKKRLVVIPDSTHMSLYEDQSLLETAATAATEWFTEHLVEPYRKSPALSSAGAAG